MHLEMHDRTKLKLGIINNLHVDLRNAQNAVVLFIHTFQCGNGPSKPSKLFLFIVVVPDATDSLARL